MEEDPTMPDLIDDIDIDDDNDSDAAEELVEFNETPCQDLFSDKKFSSARECLQYCKDIHGFDIEILSRRFSLDCFSFIRMINYIRSEKPSPGLVMSLSSSELWKDQKFMKPILEDDPLLMFDIESDASCLDRSEMLDKTDASFGEDKSDNDVVEELKNVIDILKAKLSEKDDEVESLMNDIFRMRAITSSLFQNDKTVASNGVKSVSEVNTESDDSYYASSYSHFGIHHEMLSDASRTEAYRDAIKANQDHISDKYVLDLGCGTGILSMFCADLGKARKVVGVDMSEAIHYAMDIIRENKFEDRISLLKGRLEDLDLSSHLPESQKFDVLVSEWMGYFLLFEGMLDSVIFARDNFLKKGGLMLPNRFTMHLVGLGDEKRYQESVDFWGNVYGYKMSCMKKPSLSEASVEVVKTEFLISESVQIHQLDANTCTLADTEFESEFKLKITKDGYLTGLAGYFDSFFDEDSSKDKIVLPTGPNAKYTHWKQTVFYLAEKVPVKIDQVLDCSVKVNRASKNIRGLKVVLAINGKLQTFSIE